MAQSFVASVISVLLRDFSSTLRSQIVLPAASRVIPPGQQPPPSAISTLQAWVIRAKSYISSELESTGKGQGIVGAGLEPTWQLP